MLLSDRDIRLALKSGDLIIEPLQDSQYQPASVDLRLGNTLRRLREEPFAMDSQGFVLQPGQFILGETLEWMHIPPHLAAQFSGKSSLGRIGLQTHCTAGFVDPGFKGTLTVELANLSDTGIWLTPGQYIGQLCLFRLSSRAERPYGQPGLGSRYVNQHGPTPAFDTSPVTR